jgi:hypothetical protein
MSGQAGGCGLGIFKIFQQGGGSMLAVRGRNSSLCREYYAILLFSNVATHCGRSSVTFRMRYKV